MKRFKLAIVAAFFGSLVVTLGTAFAQSPVPVGFPPQSGFYDDAVLLARLLPLVALLAIGYGIWQGKTTMRDQKSSPNSSTVVRHDWGTIVAHWTNGLGFIIGMITGMIVLRRLPRPDEMRIIFQIHYIGSGLVIFGVVSHLTQNAVTGGMGLIPRSLKDISNGLGQIVGYTGVFGSEGAVFGIKLPKGIRSTFGETFSAFGLQPTKKVGKFLPVEKVFSYTPWAIIIGVMVVTGLIKSLRYIYPISPDLIAPVTTLHDIFAYVAVAMLAIHLAAILLVPHHWSLLVSMLTTRISRKYVQDWHPLWYKQLVEREQSTSASPAAVPSPQATTSMAKETKT